ncbi:MAG: hypothetical protein AB1779_04710 [Candidatus Thermoplasmatota archaeon]
MVKKNVKLVVFGCILIGFGSTFASFSTCALGDGAVSYVKITPYISSYGYPGDNVVFGIGVENIKHTTWDDTLYNVTVEISDIREKDGSPLVTGYPVVWLQKRVDNEGKGYTIWDYSHQYFSGFNFNIKGDAALKWYNFTVKIVYKYVDKDGNKVQTEEKKFFEFEIRSCFNIEEVKCVDEYGYKQKLYAGKNFQKLGIFISPATFSTSRLYLKDWVNVTLGSLPYGVTFSEGGDAITSRISSYPSNGAWFYYRVDVMPNLQPGKATSARVKIDALRNDGYTNYKDVGIAHLGIEAHFIIDFTPILNITTDIEKLTVYQGSLEHSLDITLKNEGNTALRKLEVSLDITTSKYFAQQDFFYDENSNSEKTSILLKQKIENLGIGNTATLSYPMSIFKTLPSGKHRIPILYHGYYYDDGSIGIGSTDYYLTDQDEFYKIKGYELYVEIIVIDPKIDIKAEALTSLSLGNKTKDIDIAVRITNYEDIALLYPTLSLATGDNITKLFINPRAPAKENLDTLELSSIPALSSVIVNFNADLNVATQPGFYSVPLTISATNGNTLTTFTEKVLLYFRLNPLQPNLVVTNITYSSEIKAGSEFTLSLEMENIGGDDARQVSVEIKDIVNPSPIHPKGTSIKTIPLIAPGKKILVEFEMTADRNIASGNSYGKEIILSYKDSFGSSCVQKSEIALKSKYIKKEKPADYSAILNPLVVAIPIIILIWFFIIIGYVVIKRMERKEKEMLYYPPQPQQPSPPPPPAMPPAYQAPPPKTQIFKQELCPRCFNPVEKGWSSCPMCGEHLK